ncbi:MAG: circadian clock KaiB family protein [Methanobacterium sp.]
MNTDSKSQNLETETWILRLYVAGKTSKSMEAFINLKEICKTNLKNRCEIEVIDLIQNPELAKIDQILAIPTLVRILPVPIKKVVGTLTNKKKVIKVLEIF